jgi:hypothetical protein
MYHLIYTSRALNDFSGPDLQKLLVLSRLNNGGANVTGMLIYRDSAFLQVLEGEKTAVREVFNRIEADLRHARVDVLIERESMGEHRAFGKWSMGFANVASNAQVLNGFVNLSAGQNLLTLTDKQATGLLCSCGGNQQDEAA